MNDTLQNIAQLCSPYRTIDGKFEHILTSLIEIIRKIDIKILSIPRFNPLLFTSFNLLTGRELTFQHSLRDNLFMAMRYLT